MKIFRVDYSIEDEFNRITSGYELVQAFSKYDAKRIIKRKRPDISIDKITLWPQPQNTGFGEV